ncbi:MAG: hypothetical protein R3220_08890 [Balneolaceae bacterium]|nr:hypothetical protein [Balneolaceae bacterium]
MIKNKLIIILSIFLFLFYLPLEINAQTDEEPKKDLYLVIHAKPSNESIPAFEDALAEHMQNYHESFPFAVFWVATGETYGGYYQLAHGPTNWTTLDSYSPSKEHDEHWNNEVMPLVEDISGYTFWKQSSDVVLNPSESAVQNSFVQIFNIEDGETSRFVRALQEWHEANVESDFEGSYTAYSRQMSGQNQFALVVNLPKGFSELDNPPQFRQQFEDIHGKQMWDLFADDTEKAIESVEIGMRFFRPDLSTPISQE